MIILDEPFVSEPLLDWMQDSSHPVLRNEFIERAAGGRDLNFITEAQAIEAINAKDRLYTNSENTLSWILKHSKNENLNHAIELFKDKARMREVLSTLDSTLFFRRVQLSELPSINPDEMPYPFVLKPSCGFGSMGVYVIGNSAEWKEALENIERDASIWQARYPESVVDTQEFLLEGYIEGTEYAIDAFFDEEGEPCVLNVFRHDFASADDTSDRMYVTSALIVREMAPFFEEWLGQVNAYVDARSFPVHVEVRVKDGHKDPGAACGYAGHISAIEFNPLRFAGLGCTDLSHMAYGFYTYEAYLENKMPNFKAAFASKDEKIYCMSLLNPPAHTPFSAHFDYDALLARFSHVLDLRKFSLERFGSFGFLFLEVDAQHIRELEYLKTTDLSEFISA